MSPTARTRTVLGRFPRHLDADATGKLFAEVVDGLGHELDVKSVQLGRVRRSHALGDADQDADLMLLAGLHGLRAADVELTRARLGAARKLQVSIADPSTAPAARAAAIARLPDLLGLAPDSFPAWPSEGTAVAPAEARLATALGLLVSYQSELDLLRGMLASVIGVHRSGNGTVHALLAAAAAHLELGLVSVTDSDDRYWHVATCQDLLRLVRPEPPGPGPSRTTTPIPIPDRLALEENPLRDQDSAPVDRRHGDRFQILRSGFETVPATVRVVGVGDRTVAPMVANLDTGAGVVFTGQVPDGLELRFEVDGRVTLAGASVARSSFSFSGGLFADAAKHYTRDFVFGGGGTGGDGGVGGQVATFVETSPVADAIDPTAVFPHTEGLLSAPTLPIGESRWAFFVRAGCFGRAAGSPADELAIPTFNAAAFDDAVFEPETTVGSPSSGKVGFSWREHEPFAVRLWIPLRLSVLDAVDEVPVSERLRILLDRHRAAGIHVYVQYADPRWTPPGGILRDVGSSAPLGTVIAGTALWATDTAQPT